MVHCYLPITNKFNYSAIKANEKFVKYVKQLIPNDSILELYKEIIKDLKKENKSEILKEISKLKNDLTTEENRLVSIDTNFMDGKISGEDYMRMKASIDERKFNINSRLTLLQPGNSDLENKFDYAIDVIRNMDVILSTGKTEHKIQLIGSMFPEKIHFDGENYRTNSYNKVLEYIFQETNVLKGEKKEETDEKSVSSVSVPGAGIEPAQPCGHWCLRPARLPIPPSGPLFQVSLFERPAVSVNKGDKGM